MKLKKKKILGRNRKKLMEDRFFFNLNIRTTWKLRY